MKLRVLLALALLLPACGRNPITGKRELHIISEKAELQLGYETKNQIIKEYGLYQNPEVQAYINEVGERIVQVCERKDIRYVLVFHAVLIRNNPQGGEVPVLEVLRQQLAPLERDLLGPAASIPREFEKRWEVRSPQGQIYSRLYEIVRN